MTITQLEYVLAVDKYKHFGRAAQECHVAQPTLSLQLQKLEKELNIIIFDRSQNPILTTPEGQILINQAKVVVTEFYKIQTLLEQDSDVVRGKFILGVIPTLAPYVIPLFTYEFMQNYPNVELEIVELQTHKIVLALKNDEIDAGLLVTPLQDDQLVERVLFYEPFLGYVSPSSPLYTKSQLGQKDIESNDLWVLTEGHCFRNQVLNICNTSVPKFKSKNLKYESGSIETMIKLVDYNGGHTLIPYLAARELQSKKKQIKTLKEVNAVREISLVHRRIFLKEKIINALQNEIIHNIPDDLKSYKKSFEIISID